MSARNVALEWTRNDAPGGHIVEVVYGPPSTFVALRATCFKS